jgi:hypothetical protein
MAKVYTSIDASMKAFIEAQHMFFVGTAPTGSSGHVNVSPKGLDSLRVLGANKVAYLDYVGSGVETIAHLRENERIVIMLCAFEGPPRIVRLHGRGQVYEPQDDAFEILIDRFEGHTGVRAIIQVRVERIGDSCGYGVPLYSYEGQRSQLGAWASHKSPEELEAYQRQQNAMSIDRLPGLRWSSQE